MLHLRPSSLLFLLTSKMKPKDNNSFSKFYPQIVKSGLLNRLSSSAIRVYLVLLVYSNYKTNWSYPTVKTISQLSGVNKNRIYKAVEELIDCGLIEKFRCGQRLEYRNYYRIIEFHKPPFDPIPIKRNKRVNLLRAKDGKFISWRFAGESVPQNMDKSTPQNMDKSIPHFR